MLSVQFVTYVPGLNRRILLTGFLEGARGLRRVTRNLARGGTWFPLAEAIGTGVESHSFSA